MRGRGAAQRDMQKVANSAKLPFWIRTRKEGSANSYPRPKDFHVQSIKIFLFHYAIVEFGAVAGISYLTSLIYSQVVWSDVTPDKAYVLSALLVAASVLVVSLGARHYVAFQTQPRQRVLWNAATAVGLTFSLFLSGLFLTKVTTDYSRATFLFQLITVSTAVLSIRALTHARVGAAIANDRVEARRALIVGNVEDYPAIARQLRAFRI
jgi:hypothetical protein